MSKRKHYDREVKAHALNQALEIGQAKDRNELKLPELTKTTSINATHNELLTKIIMPKIQEFTHDVRISNNPKLTLVDFGKELYRFGDTNNIGVIISNNASLPCMSLCYLKDVYYKGNVVGLMSEQQCFEGNKADEACPQSGYIDWSKCPDE